MPCTYPRPKGSDGCVRQGLTLALLVNAQHHCVPGRVKIQVPPTFSTKNGSLDSFNCLWQERGEEISRRARGEDKTCHGVGPAECPDDLGKRRAGDGENHAEEDEAGKEEKVEASSRGVECLEHE